MPPGHACHAVLHRFAWRSAVHGVHTIVFVDLTYFASRLGGVADAPVRRLWSWQQSNAESFIELLASLWGAEKLRAKPAMWPQLCLDLPQGRMLVDQPLCPLVMGLPCLRTSIHAIAHGSVSAGLLGGTPVMSFAVRFL